MKIHPLKYERELRGWSQAKVAEALGITSRTVSRWEHGLATPYPYYREQLCVLFGKNAIELGLTPETGATSEGGENIGRDQGHEQEQEHTSPTTPTSPSIFDPTLPTSPGGTAWLVGRACLLEQLKQRVCAGGNFALTALNGLPGIGKTALAIALAGDPEIQGQFSDGILWAGLGTEPNVLNLLARWGTLLGVAPADVENVQSPRSWGLALRGAIGKRRMLLIIDDAWNAEAALAFQVGGPRCAHLVTTRFPQIAFTFAAHDAIEVPDLEEADGLTLLTHYASEVVERNEEAARELVRSVGALPLALTLIGKHLAARAYKSNPRRLETTLSQLSDMEYRLQLSVPMSHAEHSINLLTQTPFSLRATIELSNQHLSVEGQQALRALGVLPPRPASFSEAAALAVTQAPVEILDELCDAGLLESDRSGRYTLHQTIADYAQFHLEGREASERLVQYSVEFAEKHTNDYDALQLESQVLLRALERAYELDLQEALARGVCALANFLQVRGFYASLESHLERAYTATMASGNSEQAGKILFHLGKNAQIHGQFARAQAYYEEGLKIAQQRGDRTQESALLGHLGWVVEKFGEIAKAEAYCQRGLELARELGDERQLCSILFSLGWVVYGRGHYLETERYLREGLELARQEQNREQLGAYLSLLGRVLIEQGRNEEAETFLSEGLALAKRTGNREQICRLYANLGMVKGAIGNYRQAYHYLQDGLAIAKEIGYTVWVCCIHLFYAHVETEQGAYSLAETHVKEGLALARAMQYQRFICTGLAIYGKLLFMEQRIAEAEANFQELLSLLPEEIDGIKALAHYGQASIAAWQGNFKKARTLGEHSLDILRHTGARQAKEVEQWLKSLPAGA